MSVAEGLRAVRARIDAACLAAGRDPSTVSLLAVSKKVDVARIRAAYEAGQRDFGENYVQELAQKAEALSDLPDLELHLIGHLQTNKAKLIAKLAEGVQSVDSLRLVEALARGVPAGRRLGVHVQVNVAEEASKSGARVEDVPALVEALRASPSLSLEGFMTIPPAGDEAAARAAFRALRALGEAHGTRSLSMGMSDDLELAIAEGATTVRVGTAIFGSRAPG